MKVIPVAEMNFMLQSNKIEFLVVGRRGRAGICRRYPIDQSVVFLINDIKMLLLTPVLNDDTTAACLSLYLNHQRFSHNISSHFQIKLIR